MAVTGSVIFFPAMFAVDSWFFRRRLGVSYLEWYIANGALVSVTASLFAVVWKNLNDSPDLIAAHPWRFLSANLLLVGVQYQVIGHHLEEAGTAFRDHRSLDGLRRGGVPASDLWDGVGSMVASLLMVAAMTAWFIAIVPLQYFIVLIAGAPARLALKLRTVPRAAPDAGAHSNDWKTWEANLLAAPVSMTNAFAALLILAIKLVSS